MKKYICIASVLIGLMTVSVSARTWTVPGDFDTVQAAMNSPSVAPGDEVSVAEGTWNRSDRAVIVREGVILRGQGQDKTVFSFDDYLGAIPVSLGEGSSMIDIRVNCGAGTSSALASGWGTTISYVVIDAHRANNGVIFLPEHGATIDHVTILNAHYGILSGGEGPGSIRDCVIKDCTVGIMAYEPVDSDYNLYDTCSNPYYFPDKGHGPHDIIGDANLNPCSNPTLPSDAINTASDGTDRGAGQFVWDAPSADFRLTLGGGFDDGRGMMFSSGNTFSLGVALNHAVCGGVNVDLYVVLDAYGSYYFWPGWTQDIAFGYRTVPEGTWQENILQFVWPEIIGRGEATFWAAVFVPRTASVETLLAPVDDVRFSWGE